MNRLQRFWHFRPAGDGGSTLVAAVVVGFLCLSLGSVVVAQAISAGWDSGRDRQRTAQIHAAEAGIDRAYYELQTGSTPCSMPQYAVGNAPDTTVVDTKIEYYDSSNQPLCTPAGALTGTPVKAVLSATSTSTNSVGPGGAARARTMESEVLLAPSSGGDGYAIYTYSAFSVPNNFDLSSAGAESPDVYARGGFTCVNSSELDGSVFSALGGAQLSNACLIGGSLRVREGIRMENSAEVRADAYSSRNSVQLLGVQNRVGRDVVAWGSYEGSRSQVAGEVHTRGGTGPYLADPIDQPLPYVGYDRTAWQSAGFVIREVGSDCGTIPSEMVSVTVPTVFYGDCGLDFSGNDSGLKLRADVALFLEGGLTVANSFSLASSDGETRKLWIVDPAGVGAEPSGWTPATCDGSDLTFGNLTDFDRTVQVFLYTCGTIQADNNTDFYGQLYGKEVTVANAYTMHFAPLPPAGVDLGGAPATPGFKVEVVYKRETQPAPAPVG